VSDYLPVLFAIVALWAFVGALWAVVIPMLDRLADRRGWFQRGSR